MSALAPYISSPPGGLGIRQREASPTARAFDQRQQGALVRPNALVQWTFCLLLFTIPFVQLSLPGTGGRITVARLLQMLIVCAALSQPRACIRFVPTAIFWFLAYCAVRISTGLWLSPELRAEWWHTTLDWLQCGIPLLWILFNVLQFPGMGYKGLWALVWGCVLCALLHIAGIGVVELGGLEGRSSIFGENANTAGATYAVGAIVVVGLGLYKGVKSQQRVLLLALLALVLAALAKTGTRTAILIVLMGVAVLFAQGRAFGSRTKRFAMIVLTGAVLAGVMSQVPVVVQRFAKLEGSRLTDQEGRARMIPVLWEIFLRSPVYGSGPDHYQFELTRRTMPDRFREQILVSSHNLALKLLVETGLIGFLLFAWCVKAGMVSAWKARLKRCGCLPLALLLPLVIAGCIAAEPSHYLVFWFAMAYALAAEV
jgi:O-antigen ligase